MQLHQHMVDSMVIRQINRKQEAQKVVQNKDMQTKYKRYILAKGIQQNRILYLTHNWRRQYGV